MHLSNQNTSNIIGAISGYFSVLIADVNGAFWGSDTLVFLTRVFMTGAVGAGAGWAMTKLLNISQIRYKRYKKLQRLKRSRFRIQHHLRTA